MHKSIIIYRDEHLIAVNKPPRIACVPSKDIPYSKTLTAIVEREAKKAGIIVKPFLLHRLDFSTSGIMLFGVDTSRRSELESIVRHNSASSHKTTKKYIALVIGSTKNMGAIDIRLPSRTKGELINAHTEYTVLKRAPGNFCTLLEARITTGRKHQIRRHFAFIKHPVVMDDQYGDATFNRKFRLTFRLGRLFLHAEEITFWHPVLAKEMTITAPLAPDLKLVLKRIGS